MTQAPEFRPAPPVVRRPQASTRVFVALLVAVALVLPLTGWLVVRIHGPQTEHDAYANLAGAEMLLRYDPFSPETRTLLAASYVDVGRPDEAIPHLEVALGLAPRSANAHNSS